MHEPESPTGCNTPQGSASVVAGYHDHQYHKEEQDDGKKNHVGSNISPKLTRFRLRGLQANVASQDLDAAQKLPSDQRNTTDPTSTAGDVRRASSARDLSSSATSLSSSATSLSSATLFSPSATPFSSSATSFSSPGVVAGSAPAKNCVVLVSVNHGASEDSDHEVLAEDLASEEVATTMEVVTMEVETTVEEEDGGRSADSGSTQDDSSLASATDSQASSNDGLTVKRRRGRPLKGSQSPKASGMKTIEPTASSKAPATRRSVRLRSGDGQRASSPTWAAAKRGRRSRTSKSQEPEPAKQTTKRHQQETAKRTSREPTRRQQQEAAREPAEEPAKESVKRRHQPDVAKETAKEAAREPAKRQHQTEIAKETIKRQHQPEVIKETAKEKPKREESAVVKDTPKEAAKVPQLETAKEVTVVIRHDVSEDVAERQQVEATRETTRDTKMVVVEEASGQTDVKASEDTAKEKSRETAKETSKEDVEVKSKVTPSIVVMEPVKEEVCTLGEVEEEKKTSEEETKVEATGGGQVTDVVVKEQQRDQKDVFMRLEPLLDTKKRCEDRLKSDCSNGGPESLPVTRVQVKEDEVVATAKSRTTEPPQPQAQPETEMLSEVKAPPELKQQVSPNDASEPKTTLQPTGSKTTLELAVKPTVEPVAVVKTTEHASTDESEKVRDSKVGEGGLYLEAEEVKVVSADHRDRRYYSSPEKPSVSQDDAPAKLLTPRSARRKSRWEDAPPNEVSESAVVALDFLDAVMVPQGGQAERAVASTDDAGAAEGVALLPPPPPRATSPQRKEGAVDASGRPEKVKSRWRRSSELETRDVTPPASAPVAAPSKTPGRDTSSPPRTKVAPSTKASSPKVASPKVSSPKVSSPKVADTRSTDVKSSDAKSTDARPPRAYDAKEDTKRSSTPSREEIQDKTPPSTPSRESRDRESRESGRGGEASRDKGSPSRSLAYEDIEENLYRFERKKSKCKKEVRRMICDCSLTKDERDRGIMGCEEDCLNRLLMIECGSRCPNGDSCSNRRFQKKSYIKVEKFLTEKKGWGLRSVETLASGTFVMEYVGEVLTPEDFRKRVKQYARDNHQHYYFMALRSDEIIDATQKGNVSRFINHSCDPNCETQKWTVNGELRIGFFTRRPLRAGEELTFDYQFQRYGKEAQKCYCESSKCRGFIGEDNKMSLKSGRTLTPKRVSNSSSSRRAEERKRDIVEDLAMEEEIERLGGGLRNRKHTLLLARLMVRGEDIDTRKRLLNIITSTTETACLRLFLDYHGLSLLWSWMVDIPDNELTLKAEILTVLRRLPIPNKTMVKDSKVMSVVHRWASQLAEARERPRVCAGEETPPPPKKQRGRGGANDDSNNGSSSVATSEEASAAGGGASDSDASESSNGCTTPASGASRRSLTGAVVCSPDSTNPVENGDPAERPKGSADDGSKVVKELSQLASSLLDSWSELKEVFRIPRLEQQKRREDEREADRKEREHNRQQRSRESSSSGATGRDSGSRRRGSPPSSGRDRRDHRDYDRSSDRRRYSASPEHRDDKKSYQRSSDGRSSRSGDPTSSSSSKPRKTLLPTPPRLSKEERRQLFALEVQQRDQEEALRRQYLVPPANGANPAPPMPGTSFLPPPGMAQAPPPTVVPAMVAGGPPPQQNPLFVYDPATAAAVAAAAAMYGAQPPPGSAYYDPRAGMPPQEYVIQHNPMLGGIPPQQQQQPPHQGMPMGAPLLPAGAMLPGQQQMGPMGTLGPPLNMDEGPNQLPAQHAAINYQALSAAVAAVSNLQPRVPSPAAPPPEASIFLTDPMQIPLPPSLSPDTGEVTPQNPDPLSSPPPFEEEEATTAAQGGFPDESLAEARGAPNERAPLEYERIPIPRVAPSPVQEQTQQVIYPPAQHTPPTSMPYAPPSVTVAAAAAPVPAGLFQANPQPVGPYGPGYVAAGPGQPMGAVQGMAQALPPGMPQVYYLPPIPAHVIPNEQPVPVQAREPASSGRLASPPPQQEVAPPRKSSKLPPHWKTAKDEEGNLYYYHALTRETQWDPPTWDEEDQDMDLGTPTYDEPKVNSTVGSMSMKVKKTTSKKKTLTVAADTSEVAKKIKELFRSKISSHIVHCLNPFRKPDCKLARIQSTEDFKHLARKLTHFVMAKELKHCKNVEDLECNDNVKHKAKEFVHKYMAKYGPLFYKKEKVVSPKDE